MLNINKNINKVMILGGILGLLLTSCNNKVIKLENLSIQEDSKFNACVIDFDPSSLNDIGIYFGDSVNVKFSNGYSLNDIPYFTGYYVKNNEPLMVNYGGTSKVKITYNNSGIWKQAGLETTMKVNIYLNESKKYLDTEEALNQQYSDDPSFYNSNEEFSNFREVKVKNIKEGILFRGASPLNNSRKRAHITDTLIEEKKINFIMDLADSEEDYNKDIASEDFNSPYFKKLHDEDKTILLGMNSGYELQEYKEKVVSGLNKLILNEGPYYIHCNEGKDRTGFVCLLIEALLDSTYDEMKDDYMTTYLNYFNISEKLDKKKYDAIVDLYFNSYASYLLGNEDVNILKTSSYKDKAIEYLISGGMERENINKLIEILSK